MTGLEPERGPRLDLSFETPGLASDLEWVLQSSQADAPLVAEALLHTFYTPIVQIVQALEPGDEAQRALIRQVFTAALHNRYRFRSGMDIPRWFYTAAVQAFPRPARREAWPPLAIALHAFSDLKPGLIAGLLNAPAKSVRALFDQLDQEPVETMQQTGWSVDEGLVHELRQDWRSALAGRYPPPRKDDEHLESLAGEVAAQAERQGFVQRKLLTLNEMVVVGLVILAVVGLILTANRLFPAAEDENAPIPTGVLNSLPGPAEGTPEAPLDLQNRAWEAGATPTGFRRYPRPTPTPVSSVAPLPTIPANGNSFLLRDRLTYSPMMWNTVWGDATLVFRGGAGYLGGDRSQRVQFWISDSQMRILSGPKNDQPQQVWIGNGSRFMVIDSPEDHQFLTLNDIDSFKKFDQNELLRLLLTPLIPLQGGSGPDTAWEFQPDGTAIVAGRAAVIVDQIEPGGQRVARLWIDRSNAFVLRSQQFSATQADAPFMEIQVNKIMFDVDFTNQRLFSSRGQMWPFFASNPEGEREVSYSASPTPRPANTSRLAADEITQPPAGFDPSKLGLYFLYPPDFDLHKPETRVQVFAEDPRLGSYRLGEAVFGNPWTMTCTRSPDGKRIAFTSRSLLSGEAMLSTRWFDITNLQPLSLHEIPGLIAQQLAFSPDGKWLAAYGAGREGFAIYIIRLEDNQIAYSFLPQQLPLGLVWSPDAQYLAWITETPQTGRQLTVFGFNGPQPAYQGDYGNGLIPLEGSASGEWQVPLPTPTGGLESCAAPR